MWMGGDLYPIDALYYGLRGIKSCLPGGDFQIILGGSEWDVENYRSFRTVFPKDGFCPEALQKAEEYSGLGEFDHHPTLQEVEERLLSLSDDPPQGDGVL